MKTIAIDIDGTLRDLDSRIDEILEQDHPLKVGTFRKEVDKWDKLDRAFNNDREAVLKWLYDERAFQLFGQAGKMYPQVIDHINALVKMAENYTEDHVEIIISSVQRAQSIPATLFWLSKNGCKAKQYHFHKDFDSKSIANYDFVVDDHPGVLEAVKEMGSVPIVVPHQYNEHLTESDGYIRLDYSGEKPEGLAKIDSIVGLSKYQIVGE